MVKLKNSFLSGDDLRKLVKSSLRDHKYKRKIIKDILEKIKSKRLVSIIGDRRRGKTTTLYSLIKEIDDYDNTLFISIKPNTDISEIRKEIYDKYENFYIFLDEITNVNEFKINHQEISDLIGPISKKVFVSGTFSNSTVGYEKEGWFDRVDIFKLNPISPNDDKKFFNRSIDQFMLNGGYIQNMGEDVPYIDSFFQYYNMIGRVQEDISFIKYSVAMYLQNYPFKKEKIDKIINTIYKSAEKMYYDMTFYRSIEDNSSLEINPDELVSIWRLLESKRIAKPIKNLTKNGLKWINSDILSSYIVNKMIGLNDLEISKGLLMESYILRYSDNIDYYLRTEDGSEVDGVDWINKMLFEIKHKNKVVEKDLKHLTNEKLLSEYNISDFSKNIIYLGETKEEDGIFYWNIYDYVREFMEEHLLEPWVEKSTAVDLDWL